MIGALIGKQEGRNIEVMNSFELLSHTVEKKIIIDKEYYYTKEEQCEKGIEVGGKEKWGDFCFVFRIERYSYAKLTQNLREGGREKPVRKHTRSIKLRKRGLKKYLLWPLLLQLNRFSRSWSFWVGIPQGGHLTPQTSTSISRYKSSHVCMLGKRTEGYGKKRY